MTESNSIKLPGYGLGYKSLIVFAALLCFSMFCLCLWLVFGDKDSNLASRLIFGVTGVACLYLAVWAVLYLLKCSFELNIKQKTIYTHNGLRRKVIPLDGIKLYYFSGQGHYVIKGKKGIPSAHLYPTMGHLEVEKIIQFLTKYGIREQNEELSETQKQEIETYKKFQEDLESGKIPPDVQRKIATLEKNFKYLDRFGYTLAGALFFASWSTEFISYEVLIWSGIITIPGIYFFVFANSRILSRKYSKNFSSHLGAPLFLSLVIGLRAILDWDNTPNSDSVLTLAAIVCGILVIPCLFLTWNQFRNKVVAIISGLGFLMIASYYLIGSLWLINCMYPSGEKEKFASSVFAKDINRSGKSTSYDIYIKPWREGLSLETAWMDGKAYEPKTDAFSYSVSSSQYDSVQVGSKVEIVEIKGFFDMPFLYAKFDSENFDKE